MKLREVLRATNWRYAFGEIFLIVVGVTIALAGTAWYEDLQQRSLELDALDQLQQALVSDRDQLQQAYEQQREMKANARELVSYLDQDLALAPEVTPLFSAITRWVGIRSNTAPYQALKSKGFDLISDEEIRIKLIDYYENKWPRLEDTYLNDREFVRANVVPYFLLHFTQSDGFVYQPVDFEQLKSDRIFRNLCMRKINRIETFTIPNYESAIVVINELVGMIQHEIE